MTLAIPAGTLPYCNDWNLDDHFIIKLRESNVLPPRSRLFLVLPAILYYRKSSLSAILGTFPKPTEALSCEIRLCSVRPIWRDDIDDADDDSEQDQDGEWVIESIDHASNGKV